MATRSVLTVTRHVAAPPGAVWDVLVDHENMPRWTPLRAVTLEPPGTPDRNGVGAVRVLHAPLPRYVIREEITRFEPPHLLGYTLRAGLPTHDHHGQITVSPDGDGSVIVWTIGFVSSVPGMARIIRATVVGTIALLARQASRTSGRA